MSAVCLAGPAACGDDSEPAFAKPTGSGHDSGTAGSAGGGGAGSGSRRDAGEGSDAGPDLGDGGVPINSTNGPMVEIVDPVEARDPNEDEVISDPIVIVRCRVSQGAGRSRPVNEASVKITLAEAVGLSDPIEGAVNVVEDGLYEATFVLDGYDNGPVVFECSASDTAAEPAVTTTPRHALLDLGPSITFVVPGQDSIHALKLPVLIQFRAEPAPLTADDEQADVTDVAFMISGTPFEVTADPDDPELYSLSVDFDDRTLFPMVPTNARLVVLATNGRMPSGITRMATVDIALDAEGPQIKVLSPQHLSLVRGSVELKVEITDADSGVDPDSVFGSINLGLHELMDWTISGNTYSERFDTVGFGLELTQLTINITARDTVGNESLASHILRLDNVPPIVDLDPPNIREYSKRPDGTYMCSESYDPVGAWAADDGDFVQASSLYRALVWDRTNSSPGQTFLYVADTNPDAVELFARGDTATPLLIDTSGDGICDEINVDALPLAERPVKVQLSPVTARGSPWYSSAADFTTPLAPAWCTTGTSDPSKYPTTLCPGVEAEGIYRVPPAPLENKPPGLYAINPTNGGTGECAGITWELLPVVGAGWACLAVRAEDNIGNVGISRPLRVCIQDGIVVCDQADEPDCTDGCTPPVSFSDLATPDPIMLLQQ